MKARELMDNGHRVLSATVGVKSGMSSERFTVQGATGVDVNLALAGPGSRSYAFVIDWHIRVLLALAWLIVGMLIVSGSLTWRGVKAGGLSALLVAAPALILYFLYHPIVEVFMHGQTPGKRIAGVRVVSRDGGIPGFGAIMIRNIFRLVDSPAPAPPAAPG